MISKTPRTLIFRYLVLYSIYSAVVLLSLYCCCRSCVLLLFPLLGRDCDWYLPVPPFYLICSCRRSSPYCYCCCCRCGVGATSFYLYRLLCPILAAGVLLLRYVVAAEVLLILPPFLPLEPPPLYYPIPRYFLFVPPNSRLFRHSYISTSRYLCGHFVLSKTENGVFSTLESSRAKDSRRDEARLFSPSRPRPRAA